MTINYVLDYHYSYMPLVASHACGIFLQIICDICYRCRTHTDTRPRSGVCMRVFVGHTRELRAVQKRLNRSRCRLGAGLTRVGPRNHVSDEVKVGRIVPRACVPGQFLISCYPFTFTRSTLSFSIFSFSFFPFFLASSIFFLFHFFPLYLSSLTPFPGRMS